MATFSLDQVEIFGTGVLQAEGVVIDKDGSAYGAGRNGIVYRVTPDGTVSEMAHLPEGSMPNGVTMDREGNIVYCDLAKQAVLRVSQSGQVSFIADQVGDVKLTMPNFASYDAEGNLYVSNSSSAPTLEKALDELAQPAPNGALVRIRPDGQGDVVATGIYLANGTAIAPDEDAVYVQKGTHPGLTATARLASAGSWKCTSPVIGRGSWKRALQIHGQAQVFRVDKMPMIHEGRRSRGSHVGVMVLVERPEVFEHRTLVGRQGLNQVREAGPINVQR